MEIKVTGKSFCRWLIGATKGFFVTTGIVAILNLVCQAAIQGI